jgi:phosphoenolpyruvate synthase/pyruvate phosphate dikinase
MDIVWTAHVDPAQEAISPTGEQLLGSLARAGQPVAPSFVITASAVASIYHQPSLVRELSEHAALLDIERPQSFSAVAPIIQRAFLHHRLPVALQGQLQRMAAQLFDSVTGGKPGNLLLECVDIVTGKLHTHYHAAATVEDVPKVLLQLLVGSFLPRELHDRVMRTGVVVPRLGGVTMSLLPDQPTQFGISQVHDPLSHDQHVIYVQHVSGHPGRIEHHGHRRPHEHRFDRSTLLPLTEAAYTHRWHLDTEGKRNKSHGTRLQHELQSIARITRNAQAAVSATTRLHWVACAGQIWLTAAESIEHLLGVVPDSDGDAHVGIIPLAQGSSVVFGHAAAPVYVVQNHHDLQAVPAGAIVVAETLPKDAAQYLVGASGLVTTHGGPSSIEHEIACALAIPSISGVRAATHLFAQGQFVTLNATQGAVYAGRVQETESVLHTDQLVTATHILLDVHDPLDVAQLRQAHADGIGLVRGEFLLQLVRATPEQLVSQGRLDEYQGILEQVLTVLAERCYPHPVRYQLHDIRHDDGLHAAQGHVQRNEPNPVFGYRGMHRILAEPELAQAELRALYAIHERGLHNVELVLPMARTLQEVQQAVAWARETWTGDAHALRTWVRCETPALTILAQEVAEITGVHGVYLDVEMLAQTITGIDVENYQVGHRLDQADPAVIDALRYAAATIIHAGRKVAFLSGTELLHPQVIELAAQEGVHEVITTRSDVADLQALLRRVEHEVLMQQVRQR